MRSRLRLLAATMLLAGACRSPSSHEDGGELYGVFQHDAAAHASASAGVSAASARPSPPPDAGLGPRLPELRRKPVAGPCVAPSPREPEPSGTVRAERPAGRPGCRGARVLEWRDAAGDPRYACVFAPDGMAQRAPLPLLLFFHGELDSPSAVTQKTRLRERAAKADLTGDPEHQGLVLLAPQGRRRSGGLRFDTEHRALDNVDVQAVDHFVTTLRGEGAIDVRRVYAIGDSAGGPMAALYAMLHPESVAAFALYGAEAPGLEWSCEGSPPPAMVLYRACDPIMPCEQVERWLEERSKRQLLTYGLRLDEGGGLEPACTMARRCRGDKARASHVRWPKEREPDLLEFLSRHSLEVAER